MKKNHQILLPRVQYWLVGCGKETSNICVVFGKSIKDKPNTNRTCNIG